MLEKNQFNFVQWVENGVNNFVFEQREGEMMGRKVEERYRMIKERERKKSCLVIETLPSQEENLKMRKVNQ